MTRRYRALASAIQPSGRLYHRSCTILPPATASCWAFRDEIQEKIDHWHCRNGQPDDLAKYRDFLSEIAYLGPEGPDFSISTKNVDPEIATIAGPQLVVPVINARYALSAANARWGSLYDALYGTDAIPGADGAEKGRGYNAVRGEKVIDWARKFLDESVPLGGANWSDVQKIALADGALALTTVDGKAVKLKKPEQFVGYLGEANARTHFLWIRSQLWTPRTRSRSIATGSA